MLTVAGLPGTGARELAERLPLPAGWICRAADVPGAAGPAVLVIDPVDGVGRAETELLRALRGRGHAVALAVARVDGALHWREAFGAARERLDPAHELPLFASIAVGDDAGQGIADLAAWCAEAASAVPGRSCGPVNTPVDPPRDPPCADAAERAAGARAGFAHLRAATAAAVRAATADLGRRAEPRGGLRAGERREAVAAGARELAGRLVADSEREADRILRVALLGTGIAAPAPAPRRTAFTVPPGPSGAVGAEDLLVLILGGSAGFGLARAVVSPLGGWLGLHGQAPLLGTVAGLIVAVWVVAVRRRATARSALRCWASEVVAAVREYAQHEAAATIGAAEVAAARELGRLRGGAPAAAIRPAR